MVANAGGTVGIMYHAPFLGDPWLGGHAETIVKHIARRRHGRRGPRLDRQRLRRRHPPPRDMPTIPSSPPRRAHAAARLERRAHRQDPRRQLPPRRRSRPRLTLPANRRRPRGPHGPAAVPAAPDDAPARAPTGTPPERPARSPERGRVGLPAETTAGEPLEGRLNCLATMATGTEPARPTRPRPHQRPDRGRDAEVPAHSPAREAHTIVSAKRDAWTERVG